MKNFLNSLKLLLDFTDNSTSNENENIQTIQEISYEQIPTYSIDNTNEKKRKTVYENFMNDSDGLVENLHDYESYSNKKLKRDKEDCYDSSFDYKKQSNIKSDTTAIESHSGNFKPSLVECESDKIIENSDFCKLISLSLKDVYDFSSEFYIFKKLILKSIHSSCSDANMLEILQCFLKRFLNYGMLSFKARVEQNLNFLEKLIDAEASKALNSFKNLEISDEKSAILAEEMKFKTKWFNQLKAMANNGKDSVTKSKQISQVHLILANSYFSIITKHNKIIRPNYKFVIKGLLESFFDINDFFMQKLSKKFSKFLIAPSTSPTHGNFYFDYSKTNKNGKLFIYWLLDWLLFSDRLDYLFNLEKIQQIELYSSSTAVYILTVLFAMINSEAESVYNSLNDSQFMSIWTTNLSNKISMPTAAGLATLHDLIYNFIHKMITCQDPVRNFILNKSLQTNNNVANQLDKISTCQHQSISTLFDKIYEITKNAYFESQIQYENSLGDTQKTGCLKINVN